MTWRLVARPALPWILREEKADIMRIFGILLCLAALGLTGYSALTYKAPGIEADIKGRALQALSPLAADDVDVRVDGRHVTLAGRIADDEQRLAILNAAAALPGALGPIDHLEMAAIASPYRFSAVKDEGGDLVVEGHAPTVDVKSSIEAEAKALFGDEASVRIDISDGAPSDDWQTAAMIGLDALATMRRGKLSITDGNIVLEGEVASKDDVEAIDIFATTMPEGYSWTHDVGIRKETVEPFSFSVIKSQDGSLSLQGFAPDEETRAALIDEGKAISGDKPLIADIQIADGMPDQEWPALVQAGISAMKDMEAGRFDVTDNDVSFASNPEPVAGDSALPEGEDTAQDQPATEVVELEEPSSPAADTALDAALAPENDEPEALAPSLTIDKVEEGVWAIHGAVPDEQSEETLVAVIKERAGVEDVEVELDLIGAGSDENWLGFATDHVRSLDEVRAGRLSLEAYQAHLIGVVETADDIEPVETALAAIDPAMTIDLQPIDPRPIASLDLKLSPADGIHLTGALPGGISEGEALLALGIRQYDGRLEENGRGPAETWRQNLSDIGTLLPAFEEIELSLGGERPTVKGQINAHGNADEIAQKLSAALGDDRQPLIDVATATIARDDGEQRTNPLTGDEEVYRRGYWLPSIDIAAGEETCRERSSAMLTSDKITFLRGEDNLDDRAELILNALASLAIACLEDANLVLEIGGHTDSRGAADMNQELSQARAEAVRSALAARGVDIEALVAIGYGDKIPVADNTTDEGRAANRRITFEWKASEDARSSGAEG